METKDLEKLYQNISEEIRIKDQQTYTKLFDFVKKEVFKELRKDVYFEKLHCGEKLCGSYPDRAKIILPNEFDLVMRFKFPNNNVVDIEPDEGTAYHKSIPGNILINLSRVLRHLEQIKDPGMHKFLKGKVDEQNYFLLNKFQQWLEGCFTKFLLKINGVLDYEGEKITLKYRKQGPAHTIDATCNRRSFSVDFVPGFRFEPSKAICDRNVTAEYWEAIPKPSKGCSYNNRSFRSSFTESERELISGRNQLKNTFRLMKKFREMNPKLSSNLKPYHIKTVFLWRAESTGYRPWNTSIVMTMNEMFERLEAALEDQMIESFWHKDVNLLQDITETQISSMYYEVKKARKIIMSPQCKEDILDLFLTPAEQRKMNAKREPSIDNSFYACGGETSNESEEQNGGSLGSMLAVGLGALAIVSAGTALYNWFTNRNDNNDNDNENNGPNSNATNNRVRRQ